MTAKITELACQYISDVQRAPKSIRIFLDEIESFTHVLNILEGHRKNNPHLGVIQILERPLNECLMEMSKLAKKLEPKNNASWWGRNFVRLKWPLKDKEMSEYLARIERFKTTIILAIGTANQSQQVAVMGGVQYGLENNSQLLEAKARIGKRRELILHWLSSDIFDQRHIEISIRRQENIGQWRRLLETREFKNWIHDTGSQRLLWVHGLAGAGKTFMTSFIIDHLQTSQEAYGVAYVYFDYKDQDQQKLTSMLASLGKQLACQTHQSLPKELENLYDELSYQQQRPSLEQLYQILLRLTRLFEKTFIICDSLDEYQGQREKLLPLFHRMGGNGIRLFLTSRENCDDVKESFRNSAKVKFCASEKDLATFIERRVGDLGVPAEYKHHIVSELTTCAKGTFLLAHFHIKHLYEQNGIDQILKQLEILKDSTTSTESPLDPTYNRFVNDLHRQAPKYVDLGLSVLLWLVKTRRALKVRELQLAVSMLMRRQECKHFYGRDLPDREIIIGACAGLVMVDENDNTVKLVHYTVQEFLLKNSILPTDADWRIALACTSYLSLDIFAQGPCTTSGALRSRRELHPFHQYASENLSCHLKSYDEAWTTNIVLSLLEKPGCVKSYLQALHSGAQSSAEKVPGYYSQYPKQQTLLHIAVTLGHLSVTQKLLQENSAKTNAPNDDGKTPILVAAIEGYEKILNLLLQKRADPLISDRHGITPLHASVFHGHGSKSMFMLLVDKGVNPNIADCMGRTPLHWAASRGLETESRILLEKGADVKGGDDKGRLALHVAASYGHKSVVKLLLENGASISAADKTGDTPLHMAAECGHWDMIRLLMYKGANTTAVTNEGNTALHSAASGGEEEAAAILLESGISTSVVNNKGCTPLHLAASTGRQKIVELLLRRDAKVSSTDKEGRTALHYAAENGHEAVVRTLLDNHSDPSSADKDEVTVLHRAVLYESTLKLLLEKGADITRVDNRGRTVLHWACSLGALDVVMLLFEKNARLSHTDDDGRTALHFAAFGGHESVVQFLKKAGADLPAVDDRGQTAYQVAVAKKHDASIIELLKPTADHND